MSVDLSRRSSRFRSVRWILVAVALLLGTLAVPGSPADATASQFTFFSANLTHRSNEYAQPSQNPSVPPNWTSPVNFANGRLFLRLDVNRPTTKPLTVQICVWRNSLVEETCSRSTPMVANGVQWIDLGRPSAWWKKNGIWSWATPFELVRLMIKDSATGRLMLSSRCGASCYIGTDLEEHLPITIDASSIVVAPGATLSPPPSWAGCPPEWSPDCASGTTNAPPVVNAGPDLAATLGVPTPIAGSASDDGRPEDGALTTAWSVSSGPGTVTFTDATATTTTATFSAVGVYILRLTASDGALSASATTRVTVTEPLPPGIGRAAMISSSAIPPAPDRLLQNRLQRLGFDVTVVDDNLVRSTDLTGFELVVIAPSVAVTTIPPSLATLNVPTLNMRPQIHGRLRLGSGGSQVSGQTNLDFVGDHPVAAGFTGSTRVAASTSIGRAVPVAGAVVVARPLNQIDNATVFAIETGTNLVSGQAPARRVGYYLSPGAPSRLNEAGWQVFEAAVTWLAPLAPTEPAPWHFESLPHRIPITVNPQGVARTGGVVAVALTGSSAGVFDPATLRVVEVDASGAVLDETVAIQFDPGAGFNGGTVRNGTLLIELESATSGNRHYRAYYGDVGNDVAPPVEPRVTLTEGLVHQSRPTLRVDTPTGNWWYTTQGGGFSSLVDADGRDWIQWNTTPGSAGTFRGIPNAVFPAGYLHPAFLNSTTQVVASGPLRISFQTLTDTGDYLARWDITATEARMTMLRARANYWFLYEGLPGGEIDADDRVIRANGQVTTLTQEWAADIPGEWVAFADLNDGRSLFVSQVTDDTIIDSHRVMQGNMTVFGFGRSGLNSLLSGQREFVLGLVDTTTHDELRTLVESAKTPFVVSVRPGENKPATVG